MLCELHHVDFHCYESSVKKIRQGPQVQRNKCVLRESVTHRGVARDKGSLGSCFTPLLATYKQYSWEGGSPHFHPIPSFMASHTLSKHPAHWATRTPRPSPLLCEEAQKSLGVSGLCPSASCMCSPTQLQSAQGSAFASNGNGTLSLVHARQASTTGLHDHLYVSQTLIWL